MVNTHKTKTNEGPNSSKNTKRLREDNAGKQGNFSSEESGDASSPSDSENSRGEEDAEVPNNEIIQVDFDFRNPEEDDFHGVKGLLNSFLDELEWNLSGFTEIIVQQVGLGTVLKVTEDDTPIGLLTCLNLEQYNGHVSIQEVLNFVKVKAAKVPDVTTKVKDLLENSLKGVGLIVSERLINIPFDVSGPLYKILFDEIKAGKTSEPDDSLRKFFSFETFLILTRVYTETKRQGKKKKKGKNNNKKSDESHESHFIFIRPEDELFFELSTWNFTFPSQSTKQAAHEVQGLKQLRLVMLFSADKVDLFQERLNRLINEGY